MHHSFLVLILWQNTAVHSFADGGQESCAAEVVNTASSWKCNGVHGWVISKFPLNTLAGFKPGSHQCPYTGSKYRASYCND